MATVPRRVVSFTKTVVDGIREENVTFMAASIAYQAFISLVPLLILVFFLVSVVGDEELATAVTDTTQGVLPESGAELLAGSIAGSAATTGGSVIGIVTLLWGSLKIFRGLDTAFSEIYDTTADNSFLEQLRDAFVVFVAIGLAIVAAAAATTIFAFFPDDALLGLLTPLLLTIGFTVAFIPMYYFFPDVDVTVREIVPGTIVAAFGWAVLQGLFQVYVSVAEGSATAGVFGAVMLLLAWLYFGGLVLLLGAVVNAATGGYLAAVADGREEAAADREAERPRGDRPDRPDSRDRRIEDLERDRALLQDQLEYHRARVERLESRTRTLSAENERLRKEAARLRDVVNRRRVPAWRQALRTVLDYVPVINVGVIEDPRQ